MKVVDNCVSFTVQYVRNRKACNKVSSRYVSEHLKTHTRRKLERKWEQEEKRVREKRT
ncbi:hypothetical protein MTR_0044s0130 [Medicago truncatula]|uniref:Uncharacterized protein n=1 Tax=Medicago truncatula TaxID=3880 RepID=G7ZUQ0_MEDTR|nr:hypothetical protein MTR_0044s0130 [Medicago truncatula]